MDGFVSYEVAAVKDHGVECVVTSDVDADFWSVYGRLPKDDYGVSVAVCLGDFSSREAAEYVMDLIKRSCPAAA